MALKDIKDKIINDAKTQVNHKIKEAEDRKAQIVLEHKLDAKSYRDDMMAKAKNTGETIKRGIVIDARQSVKNNILRKKREQMGLTTEEAKASFIASKDYAKTIANLVKQSVSTKEEEIIVSANEKTLDKKWLESINKDIKAKLSFSKEKGKFDGGVIVKNGRAFVNITIETLVKIMAEDVEKAVADILF